jgi:signal transduction histidine kinase
MDPKILIVEDEILVARDLKYKLEQSGFQVPGIALSGEEAIQLAKEFLPHLILMDINLQGKIDGVEAAKQIRTFLDVPIFYLTAYADQETVNRVNATQPAVYFLKPYEIRELIINLEITLHKHAMEKKLRESEALLPATLTYIMEQKIEERTADLESFSYSVSHDLRAPLRAIDGFSQILLEDFFGVLPEKGQEHLQKVRGATKRMGELIEAMLKLAHLTKTEITRHSLDMSAMAKEIALELKRSHPSYSTEFIIQKNLRAQGDSILIRSVLENLFENAWKFSSKCPHPLVEFGAQEDLLKGLIFFVRDNGEGFNMEYATKLFGVFQRFHCVEEFPGTGIGLATVQRIIKKHGGRIWAESQIGKGATFYFSLHATAVEERL